MNKRFHKAVFGRIWLMFIGFLIPASLCAQGGDWYNLDLEADGVAGVSVNKALKLIEEAGTLAPVIVAVIDDGVDTSHPDFKDRIWQNRDENAEDGVDTDGNGYVADINGWNFLGNPSGDNIVNENLELTRMLREMAPVYADKKEGDFRGQQRKAYREFVAMQSRYDYEVAEIQEDFSYFAQLTAMYSGALAFARERIGREDITINELMDFQSESEDDRKVIQFLIKAEAEGLKDYIEEGAAYFEGALNYHYNFDYAPRNLVNEADSVAYGNHMVWAENPTHGTHVAGIIAAIRGNEIGVDGIAPNAIILPVRAVPNGDERDKDIALAIRYAVDQGAKVINMSFGKSYSPHEGLVREAMMYARSKDVLLVHAAGNDASDNDRNVNYPDGTMGKRKSLDNWITVAASGPTPGPDLLADFSNYGRKKVDIMAPGVDIESLAPGGTVAVNSGTSMAAPVVSGVAALIRGLDPSLSAKEVKQILIRTSTPYPGMSVGLDEDAVLLKKIMRNPGIVSAEAAVRYTLDHK
jgi:subtilisin family serine protease